MACSRPSHPGAKRLLLEEQKKRTLGLGCIIGRASETREGEEGEKNGLRTMLSGEFGEVRVRAAETVPFESIGRGYQIAPRQR